MNLALAVKYGTNESLFLTNLCFWIEKNRANKAHFHKGHYWIYNSMAAWSELFPYFTRDQIRHIIAKLKREKIILVDTFNRTKYDRTQWYTVTDTVLAVYSGKTLNAVIEDQISERNGTEEPECPKGRMETGEMPYPCDAEGEWKGQKSRMEAGETPDRSGEIPAPIPDLKQNLNASAAAASKNKFRKSRGEYFEIESLKTHLALLDKSYIFDELFYKKAADYLNKNRLDEKYLSWLHEECRKKKLKSPCGFFYTLFFKSDITARYRADIENKEKDIGEHALMICPVCGFRHGVNLLECPECGLKYDERNDGAVIEHKRRFLALSEEDRESYKNDYARILSLIAKSPEKIKSIKEKLWEIDKKYHLIN
jgi:rubrerythrin